MAKPKTEVAKHESAPVAVYEGGEKPDYIKDEQRGSENVGQEDIVIPRLEIVQALSPAVKDGDAGFIPEARPGMLMNSVSKQLYGKEVMVIPVIYIKQWLVWGKRKDKDNKPLPGGFHGGYNTPEEAKARFDEEGGDEANLEIIDTPQHLCLLINSDTGKTEEIMISMPKTKAKISRQWNSMVRMAGGDRFSRAYRVASALEKKTQGDYYNFAIAQSGWPAVGLYKQAEALYQQMVEGRAVTMDVSDFDKSVEDDTDAEM